MTDIPIKAKAECADGPCGESIAVIVDRETRRVTHYFAGDNAQKTLDGWKVWLVANNNTVMFLLLLIIGAKLVGVGLDGLFG